MTRAERLIALEVFKSELERDPHSLVVVYRIAETLAELGLLQESFDAFDDLKTRLLRIPQMPAEAREVFELVSIRAAELLRRLRGDAEQRTYLAKTLEHLPESAALLAELGRKTIGLGLIDDARALYDRLDCVDPDSPHLVYGRAAVFEATGRYAEAEAQWRRRSFDSFVLLVPYTGDGRRVRVLLVLSVLYGNVAVQHFLAPHNVEIINVLAETYRPGAELPEHDVVMQAIGDADRCPRGLALADEMLRLSRKPILNAPQAVLHSGRIENARRFRTIDGVVTARMHGIERARLLAPDVETTLAEFGFDLPVLVRSLGTHQGEEFFKVDRIEDLAPALARISGDVVTVMSFLDTRDGNGLFRKYRIMSIDGELHPLHLAVSSNWKIHYFSADMAEHAAYREEERRFLEDMHRTLGERIIGRLRAVFAMLALDYAGIDFAIDDRGRLVVYEANAEMAMILPPPGARWDYRRPVIARAISAAERMIVKRADFLPV